MDNLRGGNAYGYGSFSWDGATLLGSTTQLAGLSAFSIDGSMVVGDDGNIYSGRAGSISQINPSTGAVKSVGSGVNNNVTSIDPARSTVYAGWKDTPLATLVTGTNFATGTRHPLSGNDTVATGLAWDSSGTVWYTTGGEDRSGNVGTINLSTFTTTRRLSDISATSITFDPFTGHIFTAGINGVAQINPSTGAVVSTWLNPRGTGLFIQNLAATGKGHLIAFDDGLIRIWDFSSGSRLIGAADTIQATVATPLQSAGLALSTVQIPAIINISTRLPVETGENVLIGGFIVTGNAPKRVIIRSIGPSLKANGVPVPGTLQDPTLELHAGTGALLGKNDDWRSTQEQEIIDTTVPPNDDREAAIVATLSPGNYTAIVAGKNANTGIGLVEVYDLGTASNSKLAQISTRGKVLTADNVMIGGFIISGATTKVLLRAIGPELTTSGISGALQDTVLELRDGSGSLIMSNDDWRSDQQQQIIDTTVPPKDDRESAIVANLVPGAYTAIVRGKGGTTGVALVEVYALQ